MKLIIGLGNPGKQYEKSRHNAGFLMLDKIKEQFDFSDFKQEKSFNAELSEKIMDDNKIILAKPQTFMNNSGEAVQKMMAFYKLTPEDILVIHDDLDIAIGKYKIAEDSRSAGHNGVQNIIDLLGTQTFKRARIGIGQTEKEALVCRLDAHDFVLEKFTQEELKKIEGVFESALEEIKNFL